MTSYIEAVEKMIDQHNKLPIRIKELEESNKELALQLLAASGQAVGALDKAVVAEAKLIKAVAALRHTLDKPRSAEQTYAALCSEIMWEIRFVLAELESGK